MDGNGDFQPFFNVMIWFIIHPVETTIENWLFGVPGVSNIRYLVVTTQIFLIFTRKSGEMIQF